MPSVLVVIAWVAVITLFAGTGVWSAIKVTTPQPAVHAAGIEACDGPTEIAELTAASAPAVSAVKGAQPSSGNLITSNGPLPVTARVVNGEYVVTLGTGAGERTCHVPIAKRQL